MNYGAQGLLTTWALSIVLDTVPALKDISGRPS
jgi:hypothetical protein